MSSRKSSDEPTISWTKHIVTDASGDLVIDGCRGRDLVANYGAPLWVISENTMRENLRRLSAAFSARYPRVKIAYASKANHEPAVIAIAASEGALVDVVSLGQAALAQRAGVPPSAMILNGTGKSEATLRWAVERGVGMLNVDSLDEVASLTSLATTDSPTQISIRLASDPARHADDPEYAQHARKSKFGMSDSDAEVAIETIVGHPGLHLAGLHSHIGWTVYGTTYSVELDLLRHQREVEHLGEFAALLKERHGLSLSHMNLGGGFRVGRAEGFGPGRITEVPTAEAYADAIAGRLRSLVQEHELGALSLILEVGGYAVADAGVLLAAVSGRKTVKFDRNVTEWLFLEDTSAYHFLRRLMFDIYHHVIPATHNDENDWQIQTLAGPICTGDSIANAVSLPRLERGDLIGVLDQGAYCEAVASDFCSFPIPPCVIARSGSTAIARGRVSVEEYAGQYSVPPWLVE